MKIKELIQNINFENKKLQTDPSWEELFELFNLNNLYWSDNERLKAYFIRTWYCTDTWVGWRAYFLDGEFIAFSTQTGRKMGENFQFPDNESALKLKEYLKSLIEEQEDPINFDLLDLEQVVPNQFRIEYNTQIIHEHAWLNGEKVKITKYNFEKEGIKSPNYFHSVEIQHYDGKKEIVSCKDLLFDYNTLD